MQTSPFVAKEPYKRDYILQKRIILLRSLLITATNKGGSQRKKGASQEGEEFKQSASAELDPYKFCLAGRINHVDKTHQNVCGAVLRNPCAMGVCKIVRE